MLRHEDIDGPRVRPEFYQAAEDDLAWLGLHWDGVPLRQSARTAAYDAALNRLREMGVVYPCFCTRKEIIAEISSMAAAPHGPEGPVYPRTCQKLTTAERERKINAGVPYAWRLDAHMAATIAGRPLTFDDLRFGKQLVVPELLGDVVLARKDIGTAYHLAVVVDDAYQDISHVTRGEDLLASTHVHRLLQELLGLPAPTYLHHRLVLDANATRLAKRCDALAISTLRANGARAQDLLDGIAGLLPF